MWHWQLPESESDRAAFMVSSYPGNRSDAWFVKLVEGVLALFDTSELKQVREASKREVSTFLLAH